MKFFSESGLRRLTVTGLVCAAAILMTACAGSVDRPKPAELKPIVPKLTVRQAWAAKVGNAEVTADPAVVDGQVALNSTDGVIAVLDAQTGKDVWRTALGSPLSSGTGYDGRFAAVISGANEVVTLDAGREIWRKQLGAKGYTSPLVAGARVFVLTADRTVTAFDGASGRKLWSQTRAGEPLVLRQAGVMLAVGDTLVVGLSGRLVGLNPANGSVRWEAPLATPRGTNDVERLVDLVGRSSRRGDVVCARAFQTSVGCVNAARGNLLWTKPANGATGVHGDEQNVYGAESDGKVTAWRRSDGEKLWTQEQLSFRGLSAPLAMARAVVVGDASGMVHILSGDDGSPLARLSTDGSAITSAPVLAGNTLVILTQAGNVFGFVPN